MLRVATAETRLISDKNVRRIILDVEGSFDRRSFCWDDIRRFAGLQELVMIVCDTQETADELMEDRRDELMVYVRRARDVVKQNNPRWVVPQTEVVSPDRTPCGGLLPVIDVSKLDSNARDWKHSHKQALTTRVPLRLE